MSDERSKTYIHYFYPDHLEVLIQHDPDDWSSSDFVVTAHEVNDGEPHRYELSRFGFDAAVKLHRELGRGIDLLKLAAGKPEVKGDE